MKEKMCVLVRIAQRNRPMREKVFRELANITAGLVNLKSEGMADILEAQVRAAVKVQRQCTGWQLCLALGGMGLCYMKVSNLSGKAHPHYGG